MVLKKLFRSDNAKKLSQLALKESSSHTVSTHKNTSSSFTLEEEDTTEDPSEHFDEHNGFFHGELKFVREHPKITKVTLQDFVGRYEREDIIALENIIRLDHRSWKLIKFVDKVDAANYRRWLFKRENIKRLLALADQEGRFPITFEAMLDVDLDDMPTESLFKLLFQVRRDPEINSVQFTGAISPTDMKAVVGYMLNMLRDDEAKRNWKGIVFRFSFDGQNSSDYDQWEQALKESKRKLKAFCTLKSIPVEVSII